MMNSMEIALRELLECSICSDIFEDPRQLSCVHTFCLRCLEGIVRHNQQVNDVICPLCRNVSKLPQQGVQSLQKNLFIAKVKEVLLISRPHCDICEGEDISLDLFYCIDCMQRFCGKCRRDTHHNKIQIMRNHQLVDLRNGESANEIARNIDRNRCEEHVDETVKMFCSDCKLAVCMVCFAVNHSKHECEYIRKVCDRFREQLQQNITTVAHYKEQCVLICEVLDKERMNFLDEVTTCESSVVDTTNAIKQLVDAHATQLLDVLESLKAIELKNIESRKIEMKNQAAILESYERYTKEVIDKGSFKDMSHTITDLNNRAKELKKASEPFLEHHRIAHVPSGVVFTSSSFTDDFHDAVDGNIIGMITLKATFARTDGITRYCNTKKLLNIETELTSARNEIDKLNKVISSTKTENSNLRSRLNSCLWNEKMLKTQLEQARKTETRIKEMEKQVKKATEAKRVIEEQMKRLMEEVDLHHQTITQFISENESQKNVVEGRNVVENSAKKLTADANQHNQAIEKLRFVNKSIKLIVEAKNKTKENIRTLMIENGQHHRTIEELMSVNENLKIVEQEKNEAEEKVRTLTIEVDQHRRTIEGLMPVNKNLKIIETQKNEAEKKMRTLMIEVDQHRRTIKGLISVNEHLKIVNKEKNEAEKKVKTLMIAVDQHRKTIDDLMSVKETLKIIDEAKNKAEEKVRTLRLEVDQHRRTIEELMSLNNDLKIVEKEKNEVEEKVRALMIEVDQHRRTIEELMSVNKNLKIVETQKNEAEKKIRTLMIEVDQHRRTIEDMVLEKENLQKEIQRCDQEQLEMKKKNETLSKPNFSENINLKTRQNIDALQLQIDQERREYETLHMRWTLSEKEKRAIILMKQSAQINFKREKEKNEELNLQTRKLDIELEAMKAANKELSAHLASTKETSAKSLKELALLKAEIDRYKEIINTP